MSTTKEPSGEAAQPQPASVAGLDFVQEGDLFLVEHNGARHYLNPTAAIVLQLCDGRTSIDGITAALTEVYGDVPDLDAHVRKCIDDLGRRDLLTH